MGVKVLLKRGYLFGLMAAMIVGATAMLYPLLPGMGVWVCGGGALLLIMLGVIWRSVGSPLDMVEKGFGLLMAQDFNSRLRKVGEFHADRIAELFNRMGTRLKEERLRLNEQEYFLKKLIEVSPLGVAVLDFNLKIRLVNKSFLSLCSLSRRSEDLTGKDFNEIDSDNDLIRTIETLPLDESVTIRTQDTSVLRVSKLWFMEYGMQCPFIIIEPLTHEVIKAEREAYEKIIRVIAHEVNNTLGGIVALLELLGSYELDPGMHELGESALDRCRSLSAFLGTYTDIVKLPEPKLIPADLAHEINRLRPFLTTVAGDRIGLEVVCEDKDMTVAIDLPMIEQVILNIVKNGAESIMHRLEDGDTTPGLIRIHIYKDNDGRVNLDIIDNGDGIDDATAGKLFTPFFTTKANGHGIGLTLIREVLYRHDSRFSLRTLPSGETCFHIRFNFFHPQ